MDKSAFIKVVSFLTLLSGAVNLYSAINPPSHRPQHLLRQLLPLEFLHFPRSFTLLLGLALIVFSVNLWKRKRRAFQLVLALASLSVLFHLLKRDAEQALFSLLLIALLLWLRKRFTVRSRQPDWHGGVIK